MTLSIITTYPLSNDPIIGTLAVHSNQEHQYTDPNVVKIAVELNKALYFSRSSIPLCVKTY